MNRYVGILLGLLVICSAYIIYSGLEFDRLNRLIEEQERVIAEKEVIVVEKIVEIEKIVTTVVYYKVEVPVIKYRNIYARQFESVEHFEQWYLEQDFGIIYPSPVYKVDCDDYAERVQTRGVEHGYSISQALAIYSQYFGIVVRRDRGPHTANLVLIDDVYYYFEPTPGDFDMIRLTARD